jgi:hypothetical protein
MSVASRGATERRLSYFNTCTMARSVPAYSPTARLRAMSEGPRRQRAQTALRGGASSAPTVAAAPAVAAANRPAGSGSPHTGHSGGVTGRMAAQHASHTGPAEGLSSSASQTAHAGATMTEIRASMRVERRHGDTQG